MSKGARIRVRSVITGGLQPFGLMASLGCATAAAATLAPGVQQKLSGATFEVVLAKPSTESMCVGALDAKAPNVYQMPPSATVIASPFTPPAASVHRNAITCATSRGSSTRFCG